MSSSDEEYGGEAKAVGEYAEEVDPDAAQAATAIYMAVGTILQALNALAIAIAALRQHIPGHVPAGLMVMQRALRRAADALNAAGKAVRVVHAPPNAVSRCQTIAELDALIMQARQRRVVMALQAGLRRARETRSRSPPRWSQQTEQRHSPWRPYLELSSPARFGYTWVW